MLESFKLKFPVTLVSGRIGVGLSSVLKTGDLEPELFDGGSRRIVRQVSTSLRRCRTRMPEQSSYDFETQSARYEVRSIRVPVAVPSVVRNFGAAHNASPELLELAQWLTSFVSRE